MDIEELDREFRDKYVKTIEGRDYIQYVGLLVLAHDRLRGTEITLIQAPTPDNNNTAIVHAAIKDADGCIWSALGDASDQNCCDPELIPHKIRLAETRAKGRALRDMLGIDMVMVEELSPPATPLRGITSDQSARITQLMQSRNISKEKARDLLSRVVGKESLQDVTAEEADVFIMALLNYSPAQDDDAEVRRAS